MINNTFESFASIVNVEDFLAFVFRLSLKSDTHQHNQWMSEPLRNVHDWNEEEKYEREIRSPSLSLLLCLSFGRARSLSLCFSFSPPLRSVVHGE